jgi:hypothetical protein
MRTTMIAIAAGFAAALVDAGWGVVEALKQL